MAIPLDPGLLKSNTWDMWSEQSLPMYSRLQMHPPPGWQVPITQDAPDPGQVVPPTCPEAPLQMAWAWVNVGHMIADEASDTGRYAESVTEVPEGQGMLTIAPLISAMTLTVPPLHEERKQPGYRCLLLLVQGRQYDPGPYAAPKPAYTLEDHCPLGIP